MPPKSPALPVPDISVNTVPKIKFGGTLVGLLGSACFSTICLLQEVSSEKLMIIKMIIFIFFIFFFLNKLKRKVDVEAIISHSRGLQTRTRILGILIYIHILIFIGKEIK